MKAFVLSITVSAFLSLGVADSAALTLGPVNFNDSQFGDALLESDGGAFRSGHWLNIVRSDPGNPAALTGPNVDTGIGNIGLDGNPPIYTIFYNTPITNGSGMDLGIICARFSSDSFDLAVSTNGTNFTPFISFGPAFGVDTGAPKSYYYGGAPDQGLFPSILFVTPVDLSLFGLAQNATISAVQITSLPQGDLIRVAGLEHESEIVLIAAASRKTHGAKGAFDINLPLTGHVGIECRSGLTRYTLIFTFNNEVTGADSASSSCGTVSIAVDPANSHNLLVSFNGATCNAQTVTVTLTNVHDSLGNTLGSASASVGILIGDVLGDGHVGNGDIGNVQGVLGQRTNSSNFRDDVTVDGRINNQDVQTARSHRGESLP